MSNRPKIKVKRKKERPPKSAMAVMMHFSHLWTSDMEDEEFIESLCCEECADLRSGVCEGKGLRGQGVLRCMEGKVFDNFEEFGGN